MSIIRDLIDSVKGKEFDFTSIGINRAILLLAFPMVLEMIGESIFAVVDIYFVGSLGPYAISTVGLTESILFVVFSVSIGISTAVTALVARRTGEKNLDAAKDVTFQAIIISLLISLAMSIVGYLYSADLLMLMGASFETLSKGQGFMEWMLVGNLPILMLFMLNGAFRGVGNASIAMKSLLIGNIGNIILDPFFIFGWWIFPEMGVTGAAVASVIGRSMGVVYQIYSLQRKNSRLRLMFHHIRIKLDTMKQIIQIAYGGFFQYFVSSVSWIILTRITSELGQNAVASFTIVLRVIMFTLLPSWGVSNAAATLVGQNLGAKKPERAEKSVWRAAHINAIFLLFVAIVYYIFSDPIVFLFSKNPEVLKYASSGLKVIALGYIFYGYGMIISQSFNGAGDTKTPMRLNIVSFIFIKLPLAYFLAIYLDYGQNYIYASIAIAYTVLALLGMYIFKQGKWKLQEV